MISKCINNNRLFLTLKKRIKWEVFTFEILRKEQRTENKIKRLFSASKLSKIDNGILYFNIYVAKNWQPWPLFTWQMSVGIFDF